MKKDDADDPRFHHEIWSGPKPESEARVSGIYYVENHNGQCSYSELATDFKMAADLLIERQLRDRIVGNWTAPVAHLVRQTVELHLKALLDVVTAKGAPDPKLNYSHDLMRIWTHCRDWLVTNRYRLIEDARMETAEFLIAGLHEIDPSGDLFRFGMSNRSAFGKQKSYDRVGLRMDALVPDFEATVAFLRHWEAVPFRELIAIEMGWDSDPYFDADDFPKKADGETKEPS